MGTTAEGSSREASGLFGWVRKLDDAVFAVEKAVVVAFLVAMTVLVFVDVVYRRLVSPDTKIGAAIATLGGVSEPATRQFIDAHVAPWVGAVLGIGLLWFAFWTAERHTGRRLIDMKRSALVLALATAAGITALGYLMLRPDVPSKVFYLILYGLLGGAWLVSLVVKRRPGWLLRVVVLLAVITPAFTYVALNYMPRGFTWAQELSRIMLLWVGFLGASICAHEGKHLRMEAFDRMVPPAATRWIYALGFAVTAGFCGLMAWLGYVYVFDPMVGSLALGGVFEQTQVPDWIASVAVPVTFALAAARFTGAMISALLGGRYGMPATEESLEEARRLASEAETEASALAREAEGES